MFNIKCIRWSLLSLLAATASAFANGWYGDIGIGDVLYNQPANSQANIANTGKTNNYFPNDIDNNFFGAMSYGYEFRQNDASFLPALRLGVTYQYFNPLQVTGFFVNPTVGKRNFSYNVQPQVLLFVQQIDIANANGVAPYISFGEGAAANLFYGYQENNPAGTQPQTSYGGNWNVPFAWQIGAGINYTFVPHWTLVFGFTYTNLGAANSGGGSVSGSNPNIKLGPLNFSPLQATAFSLSIRNTL